MPEAATLFKELSGYLKPEDILQLQSAIPGDWEVVAKAYQNREPSTTNAGVHSRVSPHR